ncbi:MAG: hypothetical protein GY906_19220 [bacterium]|nr:hypothetical protein [bacterium]
MSSTSSKWLAGCGIGCLVLVAIIAVIGYGGFTFVRGTIEGAQEATESQAALNQVLPPPDAFVPWPDGSIPNDRIERFLAVREELAQARTDLAGSVSGIERMNQEGSFFSKLGSLREGAGVGGHMFDFLAARNSALLAHEMGLGEYAYIYGVGFYAWLGHDPEDRGVSAPVDDDAPSRGRVVMHSHGPDGAGAYQYRRMMIGMLRRQFDQVAQGDSLDGQLKDLLAGEIEALVLNDDRLPWQDGLPTQIQEALEPYRDRMEMSYSAETNPFELLDLHGSGGSFSGVEID